MPPVRQPPQGAAGRGPLPLHELRPALSLGASVQVRQPAAARPSPTIHQDWLTLGVLLLVGLAMLALVGLSFWAAPGK